MFVYLSVCLFVCLSVCLSVCLFVCLSVLEDEAPKPKKSCSLTVYCLLQLSCHHFFLCHKCCNKIDSLLLFTNVIQPNKRNV